MVKKYLLTFGLFILPIAAHATTVDFNSDLAHGADTVDGWMINLGVASWSGTHGASTADLALPDDANQAIAALSDGGSTNIIGRFGATFDTSTLPDDAIIDSVDYCLYVTGKGDNLDSYGVVAWTPANDNNIVAADYDFSNFGSTVLSSYKSVASTTTSQFNCLSFNTSGKSHINLTGNTDIAVLMKNDIEDVTPSSSNVYVQFDSVDGSNLPYLEVTYHVPSSSAASSAASSAVSSSGPSGGIYGSGSLVGFHTACNEFIDEGSGSSICAEYDTSVDIPMIRSVFRQLTLGQLSIGTQLGRWAIMGIILLFCTRWLFRLLTLYKRPYKFRR